MSATPLPPTPCQVSPKHDAPSFENSTEISLCRVLVLITSLELEERDTGRNVLGSAELKGTGSLDILTKMDTSTSIGF